jgi:iron complex outermembrane receptor protein
MVATVVGHRATRSLLIGSIAALQVWSAAAQAQSSDSPSSSSSTPPQQVEKIEITGTNIKRADAATADNIQTITAEDIQRSGKETVADVLRSLSANFASYNETFSNSFSPGAGSVALRGLSQKNTLVLLNGQRIANYGFAQNLEDTYVDLNVIPANAVDHIDVLKDGASSIYGSDAIAGVVNIVLKSDYQERVAEIGYGQGPSGNEKTRDLSATMGFGSLQEDGWNVLLAASYLKRSEVLASDIPYLATQDYRQFPAGFYNWSTANAYVSDTNSAFVQQPFATCGGVGQPNKVVSLTLFPTSAPGSVCAFNPGSQTDFIPQTERTSLVGNGTFKLTPTLIANADLFVANVQTFVTQTPAQLNQTSVAYNPATGGVNTVANTLPAGNPSNPTGAPQDIVYTFQSVGPQDYVVRSNTFRLSSGLKGNLVGSWDWQANLGYSENDVTQTNYNSISVPALQAEIANGSFNFLNPGLTPAANNALRTSFNQVSVSKLETFGLKSTGDLFALPAGTVQGAVGYEYRHESIDDVPDRLITTGQILNYGSTGVNGGRDVNALFGELAVPILKNLDGDLAVREEDYSDAGHNLSPKASLRWQPLESLVLRGSVTAGFRAPSLPEISNASSTSFIGGIFDPNDPLGRPSITIAEVTKANPELKPEKSTNVDLGFVFSPTSDLSFSADYYQISVRNAIASETSPQTIVDDPSAFPGQIVRTPGGFLQYVVIPYENLYNVETNGIDFDAQGTIHLPLDAKLTLDWSGTYVDRMAVNSTQGGPLTNYAGTDGWLYFSPIGGGGPVPRMRQTLSAAWENPSWVARIAANYTSGYTEVICQDFGCGNGSVGGSAAAQNVGSLLTYDLYGEYRGIKHWRFYGAVLNLFNRHPPWDATNYPFDVTLYDATGRFASVHAEYKF